MTLRFGMMCTRHNEMLVRIMEMPPEPTPLWLVLWRAIIRIVSALFLLAMASFYAILCFFNPAILVITATAFFVSFLVVVALSKVMQ